MGTLIVLTNENAEARLAEKVPVSVNGPLVPAEYCRAVLAEPVSAPAGPERGLDLAEMLVASYPSRAVQDAQIYMVALSSTLAGYPESIGRRAVKRVLREVEWLPTVAHVEKACLAEEAVDALRRYNAQRMLEEHDRRKEEAERLANVKADRPKTLRKLKELGALLREEERNEQLRDRERQDAIAAAAAERRAKRLEDRKNFGKQESTDGAESQPEGCQPTDPECH